MTSTRSTSKVLLTPVPMPLLGMKASRWSVGVERPRSLMLELALRSPGWVLPTVVLFSESKPAPAT